MSRLPLKSSNERYEEMYGKRRQCPRWKSCKTIEFNLVEFAYEHPNNMVCMDCWKRWIDEVKP
jgi:hypothetical protein